jgi:acyl phosphate:glycerol-3-phosphate acyltransferase
MLAMTSIAVVLSYLVGSIPTGLWLGLRLRGVNIREHGSRNVGATNTLRVLGKKLGAVALVGDIGKGMVAVLLIARLSTWPHAALVCGIAAILGHVFSLFLKFRGGKGIATSAGVFLALAPIPTLLAVVVFAGVVAVTRMVSAGSISAAVTLAVSVGLLPHYWATYPTHTLPTDWTLRVVTLAVAVLVIVKHRGNVARILRGEENKL